MLVDFAGKMSCSMRGPPVKVDNVYDSRLDTTTILDTMLDPIGSPTTTTPEPPRVKAILSALETISHLDVSRIFKLLLVAEEITKPNALPRLPAPLRPEVASQDILRAAVVLIHAQLEEFLRSIARVLLPEADEACLNEIPLAGIGGRKTTFSLGKLVQHKGKSVGELLGESVSEYLERSSYNNTTDIGNLLKSLGLDVSKLDSYFPAIQQMIERRHQIVHRADRIGDPRQSDAVRLIEFKEVGGWLRAVQRFTSSLHVALTLELGRLTTTSTAAEPVPAVPPLNSRQQETPKPAEKPRTSPNPD